MSRPLLHCEGLTKRFGGLLATDRVDLTVETGEIHALIGPNGAGKTTLIAQLFGELTPDAGTIRLDGAPISHLTTARRVALGLSRTFQIASLLPEFSALDNVALALALRRGHAFRFFRNGRADPEMRSRAGGLLGEVGLSGLADRLVGSLSQGDKKVLELAVALASAPKLLLLDEPMAGLGRPESRRMMALLASLKGRVTMVLVEHDMEAVFALADRVSVLVYGQIIATGAPDAIRVDPAVRKAYLGGGEAEC